MGRRGRRVSGGPVRAPTISPTGPGPRAAVGAGARMPRQWLYQAVLGGARMEFRRDRAVRGDRSAGPTGVDQLPRLRAGVGGIGRTALTTGRCEPTARYHATGSTNS